MSDTSDGGFTTSLSPVCSLFHQVGDIDPDILEISD